MTKLSLFYECKAGWTFENQSVYFNIKQIGGEYNVVSLTDTEEPSDKIQ